MTGAERQELEDEAGGMFGDPRRCPRHPGVKTSSADGMFDAPCFVCESEMEEAYQAEVWAAKTDAERAAIEAEIAALIAARNAKVAADDEVLF
jgi:hypothetical protein